MSLASGREKGTILKGVNMKAELVVKCSQCGHSLGKVEIDTADMPEQLQSKVNKIILEHRKECSYYKGVN